MITREAPTDTPVDSRTGAPKLPAARRVADIGDVLDAFRTIAQALRRGREWPRSAGVTPAQLITLRYLADGGTRSVTELAERSQTHVSSVSVLVSQLVDQGLVSKRRDGSNRRNVALALTAAGRVVARRAPKPEEEARIACAVATLGDREVHRLAAELSKLAAGLRESAE